MSKQSSAGEQRELHQVTIPEDVSPAVKKAMERFNKKMRELSGEAVEKDALESLQKVEAGEWVQPVEKGYRMQCCDCGLVHTMNFRIHEGRAQFQAFRERPSIEDCDERRQARKVTLMGRSWIDWHEHIDRLFELALPGEDLPESVLLVGNRKPTESEIEYGKSLEGETNG